MKIPFVKMHGAGNDFVMLNAISDALPEDMNHFSRMICHRNFGIGANQVLIAGKSKIADFKMDIYNADGGRVEMCGNGIRCFAQYVKDLGLTNLNKLRIETLGGVIEPQMIIDHPKSTNKTSWVKVDMGKPVLEGLEIPVKKTGRVIGLEWNSIKTQSLSLDDLGNFKITSLSMGNPHCVIFVDDVKNFPVSRVGPLIENDAFFPNKVNVEFVEVIDRNHLIQRTWERGSGETLACGTGACAVAVAGVLNNFTDRKVTVSLKGGDLDIFWDKISNHVFKTGPATTVYKGVWDNS